MEEIFLSNIQKKKKKSLKGICDFNYFFKIKYFSSYRLIQLLVNVGLFPKEKIYLLPTNRKTNL